MNCYFYFNVFGQHKCSLIHFPCFSWHDLPGVEQCAENLNVDILNVNKAGRPFGQ